MKILIVKPATDGNMQATLMADSSLLRSGQPLFVPDYCPCITVTPMLALRIGRLGKCIARRFAHRYIDAATAMMVAQPADSNLSPLSLGGMAQAMDGALMTGIWTECNSVASLPVLRWSHNATEHTLLPADLALDPLDVVQHLSRFSTLKMGDIMCIPYRGSTPVPLAINDRIQASLDGHQVLINKIK